MFIKNVCLHEIVLIGYSTGTPLNEKSMFKYLWIFFFYLLNTFKTITSLKLNATVGTSKISRINKFNP